MESQRIVNAALSAGVAIALIGGALLWSKTEDTAQSNSTLICAFGDALSTPLKKRSEETQREFHKRVQLAREFVRDIRGQLEDCDLDRPPIIRVDPDSKPGHIGSDIPEGGGTSAGSPPSSPPGPPSGGPPGNGDNGNGGNGPPSTPPPDEPGLLDPVVDPVLDAACEATAPVVHLPTC